MGTKRATIMKQQMIEAGKEEARSSCKEVSAKKITSFPKLTITPEELNMLLGSEDKADDAADLSSPVKKRARKDSDEASVKEYICSLKEKPSTVSSLQKEKR